MPYSASDTIWRMIFRYGYKLARAWWALRHPEHQGALVAIFAGDRVLLLRQSYQPGLTLPGGGLKRGEAAVAAAVREVREEIGLNIPHPDYRFTITTDWEGRRDRVHFFELLLEHVPAMRPDNREIIGTQFVPLDGVLRLPLVPPVASYFQQRAAAGQPRPA